MAARKKATKVADKVSLVALTVDTAVLYNPEFGDPGEGLNYFPNFLTLVWEFLGLPKPTDVQYDIAHSLQYGPTRFILQAFRGEGKSYITAAFVIWLWLMNPQLKILVVSASEKKATDFATLVRQIIEGMEGLEHLKPRPRKQVDEYGNPLPKQRDSVLSFDVGPATPAKDPSLSVSGITGQITGGRADIIIADDVETPDNSQTVTMREKIENKVTEFDAIIKPDDHCRIIYLGTPQTEQSLYLALQNKGYVTRIWPARYPVKPDKYKGCLAPKILKAILADNTLVGTPTDPQRFSEKDLAARELAFGPTGFQMQYMLDPTLSDENRYPLKLKDFMVLDIDPLKNLAPSTLMWAQDNRYMITDPTVPVVGLNGDRWYSPAFISETWEPFTFRQMAIDPAGNGAAETAFIIQYFLNGIEYIVHWDGIQAGHSESATTLIANLALDYGVDVIHYETNYGGGIYGTVMQPILTREWEKRCKRIKERISRGEKNLMLPKCPALNGVTSQHVKDLRICDTIEPAQAGHKSVILKSVILKDFAVEKKEYQALYQLTRVSRHKGSLKIYDKIDVRAIGLQGAVEFMGQDNLKGEAAAKARAEDDAYKDFMDRITGGDYSRNLRANGVNDLQEGPGVSLVDFGEEANPGNWWD